MPVAVTLTVLGLYLGCLITLAGWIGSKWEHSHEFSRKVIHIGCGLLLPISYWLQLPRWIALTAALLAMGLVLLNYQRKWLGLIEDVDRKTYGTIFYCSSISTLILIFWNQDPVAMIAGSLVMAISDGLAGLIGKGVQSPTWRLNDQTKSLAGTTTMLLSTFLILMTLSHLTGDVLPIRFALLVSLVVTFLEQWSVYGIDNLTVPILTALMFSLAANSDQLLAFFSNTVPLKTLL